MKRIFDLVFSLICLLALSPLLLLISLVIVLDSKGSVFYMQSRVGRYKKDFRIFKFRTMQLDADKKGLLTLGDRDPRVTRIGYYLRKYKLDELPQLINVLLGSMSFVGPRPEVRKYVSHYPKDALEVLNIRPGITDYASIKFRNEAELIEGKKDPETFYIEHILPEKLELHKQYLNNRSFSKDILIILGTVKSILD